MLVKAKQYKVQLEANEYHPAKTITRVKHEFTINANNFDAVVAELALNEDIPKHMYLSYTTTVLAQQNKHFDFWSLYEFIYALATYFKEVPDDSSYEVCVIQLDAQGHKVHEEYSLMDDIIKQALTPNGVTFTIE